MSDKKKEKGKKKYSKEKENQYKKVECKTKAAR